MLINDRRKRLGIEGGDKIMKPIRSTDYLNLDNNGNLTFVRKNKAIDLGNVNRDLYSPSRMVEELGVNRLNLLGFRDITGEDIRPYRSRYKDASEMVRKLNDNLNERSKAMESSSTTDAEAIELMDVTSKNLDTTVKGVEQEIPFIEPCERDKLLPLRELEGLDKKLRTIRGA